jgi:hypothetical protein
MSTRSIFWGAAHRGAYEVYFLDEVLATATLE